MLARVLIYQTSIVSQIRDLIYCMVTIFWWCDGNPTTEKTNFQSCNDKKYLHFSAGVNDEVVPPDNFRSLSVVPTQEDILHEGRPFLRKNKIDGSYEGVDHYLDVQFRLLREDFVRPLRQGIAQLLESNGTAELSDIQDIRVYNNVCVLEPTYTSNGLRYRIRFDNSKLRHVRWENSKRLIFGSLMCLSKDNFESCVFATVANRELWNIRGVSWINIIQRTYIDNNKTTILLLIGGSDFDLGEHCIPRWHETILRIFRYLYTVFEARSLYQNAMFVTFRECTEKGFFVERWDSMDNISGKRNFVTDKITKNLNH